MSSFADISRLVRPNRVAVIGASDRPGSFGHSTYNNVRNNSDIPGGTFPVNPAYETVLGDPAYPAVSAIPGEPVDVAIVLVAAGMVLDVVKDCASAGVKHVMVLSSGFSETDDSGDDLQRQVVEVAHAAGMRVYGPNSPGLTNNADKVLLTMSPVAGDDVSLGPVGLVTQGGGLGRAIMQWRDRGLGIGLWASPGNEADLDVSDFIHHMVDDERLRVIGAVVEGFSDGAKFIAAARRAQEAGKPLVVLKIGRSEYGQQTAASHTASIAGNDDVADAVFRQYGVIRVDDVDELAETLLLLVKALDTDIRRAGQVCVYSFSGGTASLGADMIGAAGLRLAEFAPDTARALAERAPSFGFVDNPVDLTTKVFTDSELNQAVFQLICDDPNVGSILFAMPADYGDSTVSVTTDALEIAATHDTLLIPVWMSPKHGGGHAVLSGAGFAPFDGLKRAVTALTRVVEWAAVCRGPESDSGAEPVGVADHSPGATPAALSYDEAGELLRRYGLRFPAETFVTSGQAAADAQRRIGRPVAMKLAAEGLVHKTEVGGVALGIGSPDEAARAYATMTDSDRLAAHGFVATGVYVQEMVGDGLDVLVGAHHDEVFGSVLTVGTGGVETEIEKDVLHLAMPFTDEQFVRALRPLRLWQRMKGVRGGRPTDLAELTRVVQAFATMFLEETERIAEVEVNPLRMVVSESGTECVTLDAVLLAR
ncbi:acetate--CoA ligase family protein [Streptomyces sp. NPDC059349]|uniref:acetate--CoA ligase family protein n=1 Tax=Streptomyces sp. NPDC059349 TaxID=3346808 RepID=UPI00367546BC